MTLFLVLGALLVGLTVLVLTLPLWRGERRGPEAADGSAVAALRSQFEQLTALKQSGALGQVQFDEARQALERRIVETVVKAPAPTSSPNPTNSRPLVLGLGGFVCAVAVAGYAWLGTPQALDGSLVAGVAHQSGNGADVTAEQVEAMVESLAARLKANPDDADGWTMLGRSYVALGRHEQAEPAFKRAVALRGDDAALLTDYADALAMVNGRSLEGEPMRLIERALKLDPSNIKALALAGTQAFVSKDYAGAVRHWEKLVQLAPGGEIAKQIQGGIEEARKLSGAPATAQAAAPPALAGAAVSGTVTLDAGLAAKAHPDDTVFIFARAAEGSRMPLAILRKQVKDLPLTFTLDDSMAMTPAARLSSEQRVVVGARVSARGDATPQPGDLQGFSAPVAPGASGLKVQISEVVAGP